MRDEGTNEHPVGARCSEAIDPLRAMCNSCIRRWTMRDLRIARERVPAAVPPRKARADDIDAKPHERCRAGHWRRLSQPDRCRMFRGRGGSAASTQTKGVTITVALAIEPPPRAALDAFTKSTGITAVSYTHLRAHETRHDLVCRLLLDK